MVVKDKVDPQFGVVEIIEHDERCPRDWVDREVELGIGALGARELREVTLDGVPQKVAFFGQSRQHQRSAVLGRGGCGADRGMLPST